MVKWFKRGLVTTPVLILLAVATPTTKEMAAIYLLPKVASNERIQNLSDQGLQVMEKYLEEFLTDNTTKKGKSK